jgi:hypothetical protein
VKWDDKRRARLNIITHPLSQIRYKRVPRERVKLPERSHKGKYDDQRMLKNRRFVPEAYRGGAWSGCHLVCRAVSGAVV